ncbi:MAG: ABC transporter ATP-binding protein [Anaerolineae bacterium]
MGFMGGPHRALAQEAVKPQRVGKTLRRFGDYFKPYWWMLIVIIALVLASTWMQVRTPDLTGQVFDCFVTPRLGGMSAATAALMGGEEEAALTSNCWYTTPVTGETPAEEVIAGMGRLILLIVGLYVASAVLTGMLFYGMRWIGAMALKQMRVDVFRHIHRLSLSYFTKHEAGDLMSRITNDASAIEQAFSFALVNVFSSIVLVIWVVYTMLTKSVIYTLVSLAIVPLMVVATVYFSSQARKAFRRARQEMGSVNADLQEGIAAVREVQAFSREEENIEQFRISNAANRDANIRAVAFTSALNPVLESMGYVSLALVVGLGGWVLLAGDGTLAGATISLGLIITFFQYVQQINRPVAQVSVLWTNIQNAIAGGERIFSLIDTVPDMQDKPDAIEMPEIKGRVEFVDVHAEYNPGEPVLKGVSLTAEPGQTVAIVGPTGAGKTTIVNLIPRFYDVSAGAVLIDGIDVRDVTRESLRRQIGIVLQDTFLFSTTVMENIRYGHPDATDEEVIAAAKLAHADQFIERLPDGYQTVLGERGAGLSLGQRQLLAIARAALSDPRILILDEATSSVDTRTERLIQSALAKLMEGRTSFVIAHRLSTIRNADLVLLIDDGVIVEQGTHESLLEARGPYYELYMSQFRRQLEIMGQNGRSNGRTAQVVSEAATGESPA